LTAWRKVLQLTVSELGLATTRFVPRLEAVTYDLRALLDRIPDARRPKELPRADRLRAFDWVNGVFAREQRQHSIEIWRVARHNQADEYVLEQDGRPLASFFSRTISILVAHVLRGELPWESQERAVRMKPGRFLPLPVSRVLALSSEALPGTQGGSYVYHLANDALLDVVTSGLGLGAGAGK